jgi:shikimate kinase / 3-dehydroquinate synthase
MPEVGAGVVLVGMPGSGKSTVGRIVAERLGRRFVDTDQRFVDLHGTSVPAYLERRGEPAFREAEAAVVRDVLRDAGAVIAAGGGVVLDPLNRWALWHHGVVAWLDVPPDELVRRLAADGVPRPTFQPYDPDRLARVRVERLPYYRAADLHLDAARDPGRVADSLLGRREHPRGRRLFDAEVPRHHPIGPETTRVLLGTDLGLRDLLPVGVAVVDPRAPLDVPARARLDMRGGERAKRLRGLERVLEWMADQRVERGESLIAVGGGTVGDLAGTAAALYARGIGLVHVPTTWLAQADSSIGGKVAVDLAHAKNAVGAFWPPSAVLSDVGALRTLPVRLRRDGMAESVKSALIGDTALWRLLEERGRAALRGDEAARYAIVERSARLKLGVVARDPFERGERRTLNLGHTIGHALEIASGYRLRHGAAIALGMRAVASIAAARGGNPELPARLDALLGRLGFALTTSFDDAAVRAALGSDKKRTGGRQRWILPMEVGRTEEADDVTEAELRRALRTIAA